MHEETTPDEDAPATGEPIAARVPDADVARAVPYPTPRPTTLPANDAPAAPAAIAAASDSDHDAPSADEAHAGGDPAAPSAAPENSAADSAHEAAGGLVEGRPLPADALHPAHVVPVATGFIPPVVAPPPYVPRPRPPIVPGAHARRLPHRRRHHRARPRWPRRLRGLRPRWNARARLRVAHDPRQARRAGRLARARHRQAWRTFSALPLERLLPSRQLEDELRSLLTTFQSELRK